MDYVIREESKARDEDKILRKKVKDDFESSTENRKLLPLAYGTYNFNRIEMVNYANRHAYYYNPNYGDFTNYGGDCTNFVSQIIRLDLTEVAAHTDDKRDYRLSNYGGNKKYVRLTGYGSN